MTNNKEIKKVTDINKKFIEEFVSNHANMDDLMWIQATKYNCIENKKCAIRKANPNLTEEKIAIKARREYFGTFRSEFAKKFYPGLFSEKKTSSKNGIDTLTAAIEARFIELSACAV